VNFAEFQTWREQSLHAAPGLLDCGETNLYRALASLQLRPEESPVSGPVHRCDLARAWLARYGFPVDHSRRALVCRGVRHALSLIFRELAMGDATLWLPGDVYPVYGELARAAGLEPREFPTLPAPELPASAPEDRTEYLLVANPWKPLGRFLTDVECAALVAWLAASPHRHLLIDAVYDLGAPFHATTLELQQTGRAILLHSVTKGWLWPRSFGVALIGEDHMPFAASFRDEPPTPDQLRLAQILLSTGADCPRRVSDALQCRAQALVARLPNAVSSACLIDPADLAPGCYLFPVRIPAEMLLREYRLLAIPASAFGAKDWDGSILTSLSPAFAP